jgi:hypothetical protein
VRPKRACVLSKVMRAHGCQPQRPPSRGAPNRMRSLRRPGACLTTVSRGPGPPELVLPLISEDSAHHAVGNGAPDWDWRPAISGSACRKNMITRASGGTSACHATGGRGQSARVAGRGVSCGRAVGHDARSMAHSGEGRSTQASSRGGPVHTTSAGSECAER